MIKRGVIQDLRKVKKGFIEFKIGQQSKKGGHRGNGSLKMGAYWQAHAAGSSWECPPPPGEVDDFFCANTSQKFCKKSVCVNFTYMVMVEFVSCPRFIGLWIMIVNKHTAIICIDKKKLSLLFPRTFIIPTNMINWLKEYQLIFKHCSKL